MSPLQRVLEVFIWIAIALAFFAGVAFALVLHFAAWVFNLPSKIMGWNK